MPPIPRGLRAAWGCTEKSAFLSYRSPKHPHFDIERFEIPSAPLRFNSRRLSRILAR